VLPKSLEETNHNTHFIKIKNEISGETADAIQKLYYHADFIASAESKLNNKKWEVVADGISELAQFDIKEVHDKVVKHINHPRKRYVERFNYIW
jgi:hypothetical protein